MSFESDILEMQEYDRLVAKGVNMGDDTKYVCCPLCGSKEIDEAWCCGYREKRFYCNKCNKSFSILYY